MQRAPAPVKQAPAACPVGLQCAASHRMQRRQALLASLAGAVVMVAPLRAEATGLESLDLPQMPGAPQLIKDIQERNMATLGAAEDSFQNSELLRTLRERSEANRDEHTRELRNRYCLRQAELGVGDCAGLRLIPGATKSGVQKRPLWLEKLLGGEGTAAE